MLLWFAIVAPVLVAEVFRSPMVDYRTVALGALLPLVEVVSGGITFVLHTLLGPVAALALVMGVTVNRRLLRRRLLGIPIGLFIHQVLDASWASRELFWWPAFGWGFDGSLPEASRPLALLLVLEAAAVAVGWWAWSRYELHDPANRRHLIRTGHLARGVLG